MFLNNYRRTKNYRHVFSVSKSVGNNIFLLPTELLTNKKLPTKDSPMKHFRR